MTRLALLLAILAGGQAAGQVPRAAGTQPSSGRSRSVPKYKPDELLVRFRVSASAQASG